MNPSRRPDNGKSPADERPLSYGAIISDAIEHYSQLCRNHDPMTAVAYKSGIAHKQLQRAKANQAELTIVEFANVMLVCSYPEGFDRLRDFYFPSLA